MNSYHSFTKQKRKYITSICWFCEEIIIHKLHTEKQLFCRITHQECASFHRKKRNITRGRMNDHVQYRIKSTNIWVRNEPLVIR